MSGANDGDDLLDVAIVGCGPVGVSLANLLGQRGLSVRAFERERDVYHLPRAAHFDGEIMRIFQSMGCAEAVEPHTAPIKGMHFHGADGGFLFDYDAPAGEGPEGWAADYMFWQPELELALRARTRQHASVELSLGVDVMRVEDLGDHAVVHTAGGEHRASYVVGCDGARSLVRKTIGADLFDYGFDQPWLVIDAMMERDVALPDHAIQYCDPARPATFVPHGGRHRRWEIMVLPGEDPAEVEARSWELLEPWIRPGDAELVRTAVYLFHALVADRWRSGRLLLAGDSAHQTPPFLGQGMCAGIRDAANLAWKLELLLRGGAHGALLDTYQPEREPHVRAFIEAAIAAGSIIQTLDPDVAAARDAHFRAGGSDGNGPPHPLLGPGVADEPSERMPQPDRLDDRLGDSFAFVVAEPATLDGIDDATRRRLDALGAPAVCTPELGAWLADHEAIAALVRPDRYVFGFARRAEDVDTLTGALLARL